MKAHAWKFKASKTLWEDSFMENGEEVTWECEECRAKATTTAMDEKRGVRCKSPGPPKGEDMLTAGVHPDCTTQTVVEVHAL